MEKTCRIENSNLIYFIENEILELKKNSEDEEVGDLTLLEKHNWMTY